MNAIDVQGLTSEITEIELARQNGSQFNAEISVSTAKSSFGMITTLVIRDVTERKRAEEALRRLNEELEQRVRRAPRNCRKR